jgi:hypothetical protein
MKIIGFHKSLSVLLCSLFNNLFLQCSQAFVTFVVKILIGYL